MKTWAGRRVEARLTHAASATVTLDLEPLPEKLDNITTEDLMLLLKKRIDRIYAATRK